MTTYYWSRIFKYSKKFDNVGKGTLLEENYHKDMELVDIKKKYKEKYGEGLYYRKPQKADGIYAIILPSKVSFYNRAQEVTSLCINCEKELKGRILDFNLIDISSAEKPTAYIDYESPDLLNPKKIGICCSYDCKTRYLKKSTQYEKTEFQVKEPLAINGKEIGGFIYEIYNRADNSYYVGKTKYSPFFRWHEHYKSGEKGNIEDLSFRVLCTVTAPSELNNAEAWWIHQYRESGKTLLNKVQPTFDREEWENLYAKKVTECRQNTNASTKKVKDAGEREQTAKTAKTTKTTKTTNSHTPKLRSPSAPTKKKATPGKKSEQLPLPRINRKKPNLNRE